VAGPGNPTVAVRAAVALLVEAAARCEELWPEGGGGGAGATAQLMFLVRG
jgi:hypothetical protein